MSPAEAVAYALADEPEEAWHGGPGRTLTRRELEVAALVDRPRPGRARQGLWPGDRAPDLEVTSEAGRAQLHEVLRQGRHVLLVTDADSGDPAPWADPWRDHLVAVSAASRSGQAAGVIYLIRPDGYVAARGSAASPASLLGYLRRVFVTTGYQPARSLAGPAALEEQGVRSCSALDRDQAFARVRLGIDQPIWLI
jgi:hypothetical protein